MRTLIRCVAISLALRQESKRHGLTCVEISIPLVPKDDQELVDTYAKAITTRTKVLLLSHMVNTDSDHLQPELAAVIQSIAKALTTNPSLTLLIEGHTDGVGNAAHNLDLSKRRADAVKAVLVSQFNVDAGRLTTNGLGSTKPIDTNDTPQGRAQNRRVEFSKQ